jgi:hypothetical protein
LSVDASSTDRKARRCVVWARYRLERWSGPPTGCATGFDGNAALRLGVTPTGYRRTTDHYWREVAVTTAVVSPKLTALDRCDRCGAQAYVRVELANGHDLLFCGHHGREHAEKLATVAAAIHDESGSLGGTSAATPA